MKKIITFPGSSSRNSINKKLAEHVGSLLNGHEIVNLDLNDYDLPLYSIDLENEKGFPDDLKRLNKEVESADGFVISLAEHNGAYSAAFKNAFDWLSRIEAKVWRNKPMFLLSTSPGARGGKSVMEVALARFPYNGGNIIASLSFPSFSQNFNGEQVTDDNLRAEIDRGVTELNNAL